MTTPTQPSAEAIAAAEKLRLVGLPRYEPVLEAASIIDAHFAEVRREREELRSTLSRIVSDLPNRRDWLDPELEKRARELTPPSDGRGK